MEVPNPSSPEFENPPLIEVVFGIQFKELEKILAPHTGIFWEKIGKTKYPKCKEMPPLNHVIEKYKDTEPDDRIQEIGPFGFPLLPRHFFINQDETRLIQLQRDRFLENWRKLDGALEYPRYKTLLPNFLNSWKIFSDFIDELDIGPLVPNQYELTYVNHIVKDSFEVFRDIENIFPDIKTSIQHSFLPEPETMSWNKVFRFPDSKGRLHISFQQAKNKFTKESVLILNLTARGYIQGNLEEWFNLAHEWIVNGFIDITGPDMQEKVWKRKK